MDSKKFKPPSDCCQFQAGGSVIVALLLVDFHLFIIQYLKKVARFATTTTLPSGPNINTCIHNTSIQYTISHILDCFQDKICA